MSEDSSPLAAIQRILVALDGSAHSLAALDAAAALAAQLGAELEALFVEDEDLLSLADLPGARVMSLVLLEAEQIDRQRMERQMRLRAVRAHEALQRQAAAAGVRASFRSVRGQVAAEIVAAAAEVDLVGLGKAGHGRMGAMPFGSTLRAALAAGRPLLVAESPRRAGHGLLAVYDGSAAGSRALALAGHLAAAAEQTLKVLVLAGSLAGADELADRAHQWAAGQAIELELRTSSAEPAAAVLAALRWAAPALLILGVEAEDDAAREQAERLLQAVCCPLLLVP